MAVALQLPCTDQTPIGFDYKIYDGKIVNIFLSISLNICFGCSKEPSH